MDELYRIIKLKNKNIILTYNKKKMKYSWKK